MGLWHDDTHLSRHAVTEMESLSEVAAAKRRNGAKAEDARESTIDAVARVMK